jgi:hypothetical protein
MDKLMKPKFIIFQVALSISFLVNHRAAAFQGHVASVQNGTNFAYVVFNDESVGSQYCLDAFHLDINGPVASISTPQGWSFETDNFTYIDWLCTSSSLPYTNGIMPGTSLAGFGIQSLAGTSETNTYAISAWDNVATNSGPTILGFIAVPSVNSFSSTITNASYSVGNNFNFSVVGVPSFSYAVQTTTNLLNWTFLETNTSPFTVLDPNAPNFGLQFYRALFIPDVNSQAILGD